MIFLSWNCRGLENFRTVHALNDLVRDHKPSVLFLIKTLSVASRIEEMRVRLGFANSFSVDRVGRNGGLAVF